MSKHSAWGLTALFLLAAGPAAAQATVGRASDVGTARPLTLRVQSQLQVTLPAGSLQNIDEQKTQQEAARRALYDMANRECRTLTDVFGGECRIASLSVNTSVQQRQYGPGSPAETVVGTATGAYDITPAARP